MPLEACSVSILRLRIRAQQDHLLSANDGTVTSSLSFDPIHVDVTCSTSDLVFPRELNNLAIDWLYGPKILTIVPFGGRHATSPFRQVTGGDLQS